MNDVLNIPENYNAMRAEIVEVLHAAHAERQFNYDRGILGKWATTLRLLAALVRMLRALFLVQTTMRPINCANDVERHYPAFL